MRNVDVRRLARDGLLVPGISFGWSWTNQNTGEKLASIGLHIEDNEIRFRYSISNGDDSRDVDQRVRLVSTFCHYGHSRQWFTCPHCSKRMALLYVGQKVACRRCYGMAYLVQRESAHDREIRRLKAIRNRLGWEPGFLNGHGWKPKGMHWRTYCQLVVDHDELALAVMRRMLERSVRQQERVARMLVEHPEWDVPNYCEITS